MKFHKHPFNMIEISFALLVIAIGVTTIFGLIPIGSLAHASAVNQNQAADAAENSLNLLAAEVQRNWATLITANGIVTQPDTTGSSIPMDSDDAGGFLTSWEHVADSSNISTNKAGLYEFTGTSSGSHYRFIQVTTMSDGTKVRDFDGIVRVWQSTVSTHGYDGSADTRKNVVMLNVEISWPASMLYEQRDRTYYKMEVFCHQCEAK